MSTEFRPNIRIPVVIFAAVALFIGCLLLAITVVLKLELMQPGVQYQCAEDGPIFCYSVANQANALLQAPLAFLIAFVLVPAFLAGLVLRMQKSLTHHLQGWCCAAMWLALALYLVIPIINFYFTPSLTGTAATTGPMLFPPLSTSSSPASSSAILNAIQMNKAVVAILLVSTLLTSIAHASHRPRRGIPQFFRLGFVALLVMAIWVIISQLSSYLRMISLDRNFGTKFYEPTSQSDIDHLTRLLDLFESPQALCAAVAVCCIVLWFLVKHR